MTGEFPYDGADVKNLPTRTITTGHTGDYIFVDDCSKLVLTELTAISEHEEESTISTALHLNKVDYAGVDAFLLCFALDDEDNEESMKRIALEFLPGIKRYAPDAGLVLVGTKADLLKTERGAYVRFTSRERCGPCGKKFGLDYFACSAKSGFGLDDVLDAVNAEIKKRDLRLQRRLANLNSWQCCLLL